MQREAFKVKDGREYDHLFPRAAMKTVLKKKSGNVKDTLKLIQHVVRETRWQAIKIAKVLKGKTLEETCRNIWEFFYNHVAYKKDEYGKEEVRSLARTWHDRHNKDENGNPGGVDCDCFSTAISTILNVLQIKHVLRIVKFWQDHYQHIYPIVPLPNGSYITLDCVVHKFNYEEPFSEKYDTKMDLEYLNGVYDSQNNNTDQNDLLGVYDDRKAMSELGALFKKKSSSSNSSSSSPGPLKKLLQNNPIKQAVQKVTTAANKVPVIQKVAQKVNTVATKVQSKLPPVLKQVTQPGGIKQIAKKAINAVNKVNPATLALRAGILAAMKLNTGGVAQKLKYAYLSDAEAQKRGVDMNNFQKLKEAKTKLESMFFAAGGNANNLKEAILTGKGNADKDVVAGLGYVGDNVGRFNDHTPLDQLLGTGMFQDESFHVMEGLGSVPITPETVTAASGAINAILNVLKQIGSLFPKKSKESKDFEEKGSGNREGTSSENEQSSNQTSTQNYSDPSPVNTSNQNTDNTNYSSSNNDNSSANSYSDSNNTSSNQGNGSSSVPATNSTTEVATNNSESGGGDNPGGGNIAARGTELTFWQKHKTWLLPTSIGFGILVVSIGGYMVLKKPNENQTKAHPPMSGIPQRRKRKKKKKKGGKKPKIQSKKTVAFI